MAGVVEFFYLFKISEWQCGYDCYRNAWGLREAFYAFLDVLCLLWLRYFFGFGRHDVGLLKDQSGGL